MDAPNPGLGMVRPLRNHVIVERITEPEDQSKLFVADWKERPKTPLLKIVAVHKDEHELHVGDVVFTDRIYIDGLDSDCKYLVVQRENICAIVDT